MMGAWLRQFGVTVRSLRRRPLFTAIAISTLALGVGANTAIFSVMYGSLLRPLPYLDADRLAYLSDGHEQFGGAGINQTIPNLVDLREGARLMQSSAMFSYGSGNLSTDEQPERVRILYTSSELLGVLGITPHLGRDFVPENDVAGTEPTVILTHGLWSRRFGADPTIIGSTTVIDAAPVRVAGVTPPDFTFRGIPDVLMSLQYDGADLPRGNRNYNAVARLAPGASVEALRAELQGIFSGLVERYPEANDGWFTWAEPAEEWALGSGRESLFLIAGAAVLVLLIACMNVANLLLVRAEGRQRELAVRVALGAGRRGLIPHFLSEGLVLSLLGGAAGLAVAYWGVDLLVALYGGSLARASQIEMNGTVLAFALMVSLAVGLGVGFAPLLRSEPRRLQEHLKSGARGSSLRRGLLGRSLVIAEVAVAVVIVTSAGLLIRSTWHLQSIDTGILGIDRVLTFQISLPEAQYEQDESVAGFYAALTDRLEAIPGVEAAAFVNRLPLLGGWNTRVSVWGDPEREANFVSLRPVTPRYFEALGVPLLQGRWLNAAEFAEGAPSVLINQTLAEQLFPGEDPVGQRLANWREDGMPIVGVVGDVMGGDPTRPAPPAFYFPFDAFGGPRAAGGILRTAGNPRMITPLVSEAVNGLDSGLPVYSMRTLGEIALSRVGSRRFATSLFGVFACLALLLGAVGIYGVMSYSVAQRDRELGVRLALGASTGSVLGMVLRQGLRLAGVGVAVGIVLAVAAGRLLESLLYDVSPLDPGTHVLVAAVLMAVAVGATLAPARRAMKMDPLASMRSE